VLKRRELAKREGLDRRSFRRLLRLAFLSPRVAEAIVEGREPPDLTIIKLTRRIDLPPLWSAGAGTRHALITLAIANQDAPSQGHAVLNST
jgi:hypothetical protein